MYEKKISFFIVLTQSSSYYALYLKYMDRVSTGLYVVTDKSI